MITGCTNDNPSSEETRASASPSAGYGGVSGGQSTPDNPASQGIPGASAPADNPSSTTPKPQVTVQQSTDPESVPTTGTPPKEVTAVATQYIGYRENAMSWNQKTPRSWLTQAKSIMTKKAYRDRLKQYPEQGSGYVWDLSHADGLAVKAVTDCVVPSAAGPATDDAITVQCGVMDQAVDKSGKPIPITQIPPAWPYAGPQIPAVLDLAREDGKWLVDGDYTGQVN